MANEVNEENSFMSTVEEGILQAKDNIGLNEAVPGKQEMEKPMSSPQTIIERLEWGEPGFTIIDVRDRETFNEAHIQGALPMPIAELVERAQASIQPTRQIYVYGESDEQSSQAAAQLREAGFTEVAGIQGGLATWRNVGGRVDGRSEQGEKVVSKGAYNVFDRLKEHGEKKSKHHNPVL